jgi:hypothetical protein
MNPFENLTNAIILQAVKDYRKVLSRCCKHPEKAEYRADKLSIEQFFRSGWFSFLTDIDPEMLIRKLGEEVT